LPTRIDDALNRFDLRAAALALKDAIGAANRYVEIAAPWTYARSTDRLDQARFDHAVGLLLAACRRIGAELGPFVPTLATGVLDRCRPDGSGRLARPRALYPRLTEPLATGE